MSMPRHNYEQEVFVSQSNKAIKMSSFNAKMTKMILAEVESAILKAATPGEDLPAYDTPEAARDAFRDVVIADLAERFGVAPKGKKNKREDVASEDGSPSRKKRAPMTDEAKAAMKAKRDATIAAKKVDVPVAEMDTDASAPPSPPSPAPAPAAAGADSPKEKKKRAPMTDEAKAAMKAKREATIAAKKDVGLDEITSGVAAMTVEVKPKKEVNLAKVDPTWRKHLKTAAKAQKIEVTKETETGLLSYLNNLSKEEFNAKKAEEHISAFLGRSNAAPAPAPVEDKVATDLEIVEFEGKDYYVNPETKRVYEGQGEYDEDAGWTNYKPVGYVGMAAFTEMTLE